MRILAQVFTKWESIPPQRDDQNNTNQSTYFVYNPGFYNRLLQTVGHCIFKDSFKCGVQ